MRKKVIVAWSGGKDCAFSLYKLLQNDNYEVLALLSNKHTSTNRITMHGIREELIKQQADALGLPLDFIELKDNTHKTYEDTLRDKLLKYKYLGVDYVMHGDIFLQDLKEYRDKKLAEVEIKGIYPLWKQNTTQLVESLYKFGFRTIICSTNKANKHLLGKDVSPALIPEMAPGTDPCGENGEFHTFCYKAPIFKKDIQFTIGEMVEKSYKLNNETKYFYFIDLKPKK
jgi:uncharacterized protein (TIGR00290 family)